MLALYGGLAAGVQSGLAAAFQILETIAIDCSATPHNLMGPPVQHWWQPSPWGAPTGRPSVIGWTRKSEVRRLGADSGFAQAETTGGRLWRAIGFEELAQSARPAFVRAALSVTGRREDAEEPSSHRS